MSLRSTVRHNCLQTSRFRSKNVGEPEGPGPSKDSKSAVLEEPSEAARRVRLRALSVCSSHFLKTPSALVDARQSVRVLENRNYAPSFFSSSFFESE